MIRMSNTAIGLEMRLKLIGSLVRPDKVDDIKAALSRINVLAISVVQAHDYVPQNHGTTLTGQRQVS